MSLDVNPSFEDFIGKTYTPKLQEQIEKFVKEDRIEKEIPERKYLPAAYIASIAKDGEELQGYGCSIPSDLVLDQMGYWFANQIKPISTSSPITNLKSVNGVIRPVRMYSLGNDTVTGRGWNNNKSLSIGNFVGIGQGVSVPNPFQFDLTHFTNGGPEDTWATTAIPLYDVSKFQIPVGAIIGPTIGSGTVTEVGMGGLWRYEAGTSNVADRFLMSRDLVGSVPFTPGSSLTVRYVWNI